MIDDHIVQNITTPLSIRLKHEIKEKLLEESQKKGISLNGLLNQIFTEHVNWIELGNQMGRLSVSRKSFRSLLELIEDEKIIEFANTIGKDEYKSVISYFYGNINLDSVIKYIESWFQFANISYHYSDNNKRRYTINHDLGRKWSLLFLTRLGALLHGSRFKLSKINSTESCFSFEIKNN